jgi:hypothetical protein
VRADGAVELSCRPAGARRRYRLKPVYALNFR